MSERSTSKPGELEYSYCRVEINNQTRSKVSKPNKLGAEKKLSVNIRYFPMQLIERWLTSFAECLRSVIS